MVSPVGALSASNILQLSGTRSSPPADGAVRPQISEFRPIQPAAVPRTSEGERPEFRRPGGRRDEREVIPGEYRPTAAPVGRPSADSVIKDPFEKDRTRRDDEDIVALSDRAIQQGSREQRPRLVSGGEDGYNAARDAAVRKLRAYEAERARRFSETEVQSDPRKAQAALREDLLFFGSLSPVEQVVPEVARALRSAAVIVPLKELADSGKSGLPGDESRQSEEARKEAASRNPLAELADRLLEELSPGGKKKSRERAAEVEAALERTAIRLLELAADDDTLRPAFSPEALSAIERRSKAIETERSDRPDRGAAPLFSIVA